MQGSRSNGARIVVRPFERSSAVWTVACDSQAHGRYFDREDALAAAHALGRSMMTGDIAVSYV